MELFKQSNSKTSKVCLKLLTRNRHGVSVTSGDTLGELKKNHESLSGQAPQHLTVQLRFSLPTLCAQKPAFACGQIYYLPHISLKGIEYKARVKEAI